MTSDWPGNLEIGHFELLLRIAVGMAKAEGDAAQRTKRLMLGVHFATSMWALSVRTLNLAAAEKVGGHACTPHLCGGEQGWSRWLALLVLLLCILAFAWRSILPTPPHPTPPHPAFLACC